MPTYPDFSFCDDCLPNSRCYGGNKVAPRPGYWRSNATSTNFIKCPNEEVCLGGNETEPLGVCADAYQGVLCGDCEDNHSKKSDFVCSKCPPRTRNIIQIFFIVIAYICYNIYLVRGTLKNAAEAESVHTIYNKILTNHFQLISAISIINYSWPN